MRPWANYLRLRSILSLISVKPFYYIAIDLDSKELTTFYTYYRTYKCNILWKA